MALKGAGTKGAGAASGFQPKTILMALQMLRGSAVRLWVGRCGVDKKAPRGSGCGVDGPWELGDPGAGAADPAPGSEEEEEEEEGEGDVLIARQLGP